MIAIDNTLVSDEILSEQFVCDLHKCKGGCCVDGDAGAPLNKDELDELKKVYPKVKKYMTPQGLDVIEEQGLHVWDNEFEDVTPVIKDKMCAYGFVDKQGIVKCAIEKAYLEGKTDWKKPISCHLFPIRISKSKKSDTEYLNYDPREETCKAACALGKKLKVPVYQFLKEPIIRKYGEGYFEALEKTAEAYFKPKETE